VATGRTHPDTLKPKGLGMAFKLSLFSMWQYPVSMPAKWASQMTPASDELELFHETLPFGCGKTLLTLAFLALIML
jgi:hypothetical protein